MVRRYYKYGILLFLLIIGIGYLSLLKSPFSPSSASGSLLEESMTGVKVKTFDKAGILSQEITMRSWQHVKDQAVTTLLAPKLILYYPNGKICEISADKGEAFQANLKSPLEKLHLMENVVIHHAASPSQAWWQLETENLLYFPRSEIALTDDLVTVRSPATHIQAFGMRAYLDHHRVEFINQVSSEYELS